LVSAFPPLVQTVLYLENQDIAAPAVFDRRQEIPFPQRRDFELIEKNPEVAPGQKCHKLWHFCGVRPDLGQGPHVLEVPRTIPLDSGKLYLQVMRQPLDDFGAPTLGPLTLEDFRPIDQ